METHFIQYRKIIDLSHKITPSIPLWPGDPPIKFEVVADLEKDGYYLRSFTIGEHSATHINAPASFHEGAIGVDGYDPQSLVRSAIVIDVENKVNENTDYVITIDDVLAWEKQNGIVQTGVLVFFFTGWQTRWCSPEKYLNRDCKGRLHFPGVGGETSSFLLKKRGITGVGIDTHGIDPGLDTQYTTNRQVLENHGLVLENLNNLAQLPAKGTTVVIGILRLQAGSGSPVSVIAFVP